MATPATAEAAKGKLDMAFRSRAAGDDPDELGLGPRWAAVDEDLCRGLVAGLALETVSERPAVVSLLAWLACHGDTYLTRARVTRVPAWSGDDGSLMRGICNAVGLRHDWTKKRAGRSWSRFRVEGRTGGKC